MQRIEVSADQLRAIKEFADNASLIETVLARHAAADPDAKRLYRMLFAEGGSTTRGKEKIFLAGAGEGDSPRLKTDLAGHSIVDYEGAGEHCLECSFLLAEAGDVSIGHEHDFARTPLHTATQKYLLAHPGTKYLTALNRVAAAGGVES